MKLDVFIEKFAEMFDDTEVSEFKGGTIFKDLDEWSSLQALSTIAMVDEEYEVILKGNDIQQSNTIEDLYKLVLSRK